MKSRKEVIIGGSTQAKIIYYLNHISTLADREQQNTQITSQDFPSNSLYALLHLKNEFAKLNDEPAKVQLPDQYTFRQLFEFQPFELMKQQVFNDDLDRCRKWRLSQVRYESEFGVTHAPAKDGSLDVKKIEEDE